MSHLESTVEKGSHAVIVVRLLCESKRLIGAHIIVLNAKKITKINIL